MLQVEHIDEKKAYEKNNMSIPENREKRNEYQKQYKRDNYEKKKNITLNNNVHNRFYVNVVVLFEKVI